jgi:hypothetical protein
MQNYKGDVDHKFHSQIIMGRTLTHPIIATMSKSLNKLWDGSNLALMSSCIPRGRSGDDNGHCLDSALGEASAALDYRERARSMNNEGSRYEGLSLRVLPLRRLDPVPSDARDALNRMGRRNPRAASPKHHFSASIDHVNNSPGKDACCLC